MHGAMLPRGHKSKQSAHIATSHNPWGPAVRLGNISIKPAPCLHCCPQHCAAHKEVDAKVRSLREGTKGVKKEYDKTEDDLKALQSVGQIIGEVLRQLDEERCEWGLLPAP